MEERTLLLRDAAGEEHDFYSFEVTLDRTASRKIVYFVEGYYYGYMGRVKRSCICCSDSPETALSMREKLCRQLQESEEARHEEI